MKLAFGVFPDAARRWYAQKISWIPDNTPSTHSLLSKSTAAKSSHNPSISCLCSPKMVYRLCLKTFDLPLDARLQVINHRWSKAMDISQQMSLLPFPTVQTKHCYSWLFYESLICFRSIIKSVVVLISMRGIISGYRRILCHPVEKLEICRRTHGIVRSGQSSTCPC